jgi:hypothetical protein
MSERIIEQDEITSTDDVFVVVDSEDATELKKVNLKTVKDETKLHAETTSGTIADASGLTAAVTPAGDPSEYNYVPDETTNYLKTADFAAAALTANLKNADIILDDKIASMTTAGLLPLDVAIDTGEIDIRGGYNLIYVTGTDGTDLDTIDTDGGFYSFVLINNTGVGIKFVSGGNLQFGQTVFLNDGELVVIYAIAGVCYFQTIGAGVKGFSFVEKTLGDGLYLGSLAGDNDSGVNTIGIGFNAAKDNTGDNNTGVGNNALNANTGNFVVALGSGAGQDNTGNNSIGIGKNALNGNTENDKFFIGNSTSLANDKLFMGGYLDTGERIYNFISGVLDNPINVIEFTGTYADDELSTIVTAKMIQVGSLNVSVLSGGTMYAAKFTLTGAATQISWSDGAVFDVADTDTKFCAYYSGGNLIIKNRLGASAAVVIELKYKEVTL